jgi:hypothetical protein
VGGPCGSHELTFDTISAHAQFERKSGATTRGRGGALRLLKNALEKLNGFLAIDAVLNRPRLPSTFYIGQMRV